VGASELTPASGTKRRLLENTPIVHIFLDHPVSSVHAGLDRSHWHTEFLGSLGYLQFFDLAKPNNLTILGRQLLKKFRDNAGGFSPPILFFGVKAASSIIVREIQVFLLSFQIK
jgi:hypothetical protein